MALQAWKRAHPEYTDTPASYAGRLDPMAEGKLLILLGEECKKQTKYTGLDKEYEVEILLGVGSDTGDALGLVTSSGKPTLPARRRLAGVLQGEVGRYMRKYPQFSSKTVGGKPLFLHTLEGTIDSIQIPEHEEHIYRIQLLESTEIDVSVLQQRIDAFLAKVPLSNEPSKTLGADFRIASVRKSWDTLFQKIPLDVVSREVSGEFVVVKIRVVCGSGAYMRSLTGRIGEALGTKGLALSIHRTKIGKYWKGFWLKTY